MRLRCTLGVINSTSSLALRPTPTIFSFTSLPQNSASSRRYSGLKPGVSHDIGILGGGITGLATAYFLTQQLPRAKITVYETADRIGGWLNSKRVPVEGGSVLFEAGPRALRPADNGILACKLVQELDMANDTIFTMKTSPAAQNRFLYYPDHLVRMPHPSFGLLNNLATVFREPIFSTSLWAGLTEMFKDSRASSVQDESVGEFWSRRFSKTMVDRILSGVMHGIYAGDTWQLSAKSLFPRPWRDEVTAGSVFWGMALARTEGVEMTKQQVAFLQDMKAYDWDTKLRSVLQHTSVFTFKDGLGMLVDRLARNLIENGNVAFKTSTAVKQVRPSEDGSLGVLVDAVHGDEVTETHDHTHVIPTLSPQHLSRILHGQDAINKQLTSISSVTVMTVNLYYSSPSNIHRGMPAVVVNENRKPFRNLHPSGFGYLIPAATSFQDNPERALGVVFDDACTPSPKYHSLHEWHPNVLNAMRETRDVMGKPINPNHFNWYNFPAKPAMQEDGKGIGGSKLTVMLGGHWWNGWPAYPNEAEGLQMAKEVLRRHLNITEQPLAHNVSLQKDCIPQYTVGHEARLKATHNELWRSFRGRVRVAGNWMSGVGVNDCLRSAWDIAKGLSSGRDGTGLEHVGSTDFVRVKAETASKKEDEPKKSD